MAAQQPKKKPQNADKGSIFDDAGDDFPKYKQRDAFGLDGQKKPAKKVIEAALTTEIKQDDQPKNFKEQGSEKTP